MKAIVTITAYDRLDLLSSLISCLDKNERDLFDVVIFPDRVDAETYDSIKRIASGSSLNVFVKPVPRVQLGCDLNIIKSVAEADTVGSGYTHIIKVDSDLLVSNHFVHDLLVLSEKFDAYAATPITGRHSLETKLEHVNSWIPGSATGSNKCIPIHQWKKIAPIVTAISDRYYSQKYTMRVQRDQSVIMGVMLDVAKYYQTQLTKPVIDVMTGYGTMNVGEDGLIVTACAMYGIPCVSHSINRAIHPSYGGVHTDIDFWREHYNGVVIDDLPKIDPNKLKLHT